MEFFDFIKVIRKKQGTILTLIFIVLILTLGISLINPLKYGAKSRLLVVQNTAGSDPYTVSKSNEYLGNLFSQIVYSGSFYDFVANSQYNIDKNYFTGNYSQQLKIWKKMVQTKNIGDTGIIEINVYHQNPYQAQQISLAINDVMINKNLYYQGSGQSIKVNIIDQPLVSDYPVKPNLPQNAVLAVVIGLLIALSYAYLFPEEKHDLKLWPGRQNKKVKPLGGAVKLEDYNQNLKDYNRHENRDGKDEKKENFNIQNQTDDFNRTENNERQNWPEGDMDNVLK